jgi:hypothetical protein
LDKLSGDRYFGYGKRAVRFAPDNDGFVLSMFGLKEFTLLQVGGVKFMRSVSANSYFTHAKKCWDKKGFPRKGKTNETWYKSNKMIFFLEEIRKTTPFLLLLQKLSLTPFDPRFFLPREMSSLEEREMRRGVGEE